MKKFFVLITPVLFLVPFVAHAQDLTWFRKIVTDAQGIVTMLVPLFIGLALVAFLYGLARYIFAAGDPEAKASGRGVMIAGIIGLFVAVSIWGIITLVQEIAGVDDDKSTITVPIAPGAPGASGGGR
jgi:hypothetical protein